MGSIEIQDTACPDELLTAQANIFHHVLAHIGSLSLKCAIELGIPDTIEAHGHGHPLPLPQLVSHLGIPPSRAPYLRRLMQLLTRMGYFTIQNGFDDDDDDDDDAYSLTINSKILLKNSPTSMTDWLLNFLDPSYISVYHSLSKWLQQAEPETPVELVFGCPFWDIPSTAPELGLAFVKAMASDTTVVANALITKCKDSFHDLKSLVDVGGCNGAFVIALTTAFPHIKCTVYDMPHVVATVPENSVVEAVGGNMFEYIPKADAVFLKLILHDWNDEQCVSILKLCKVAIAAAENGGKVMIVDIVLNKDNNHEAQLYWDMMMLTSTKGKERTENEWKKIFIDAGFKDYKITPLGLRSLIEVFP